jgi:hypothetical protein
MSCRASRAWSGDGESSWERPSRSCRAGPAKPRLELLGRVLLSQVEYVAPAEPGRLGHCRAKPRHVSRVSCVVLRHERSSTGEPCQPRHVLLSHATPGPVESCQP